MAWLQLSFELDISRIDTAIESLNRMGAQATTQQNAGEDSYYDLAHPAQPRWAMQRLTGLFDNDTDGKTLAAQLSVELGLEMDIKIESLGDRDWETLWLNQYEPVQITPHLWVYPSWIVAEENIGTVIKIDPGMAFGTGTHETTRLCMRALSELECVDKSVLDYGCGSGILAITALHLGAHEAVGVDIDPKAEIVSQENALNNGVERRFTIQSPAQIKGRNFDLIIANILASALIELAPTLISHTKPDRTIILSGILKHQAKDVVRAYESEFEFSQYDEGDWVALVGKQTS